VLSPLIARLEWPADWRVLVVVPAVTPGCHGPAEQAAFERLTASLATTEALCRLVLLGMLPALVERDLPAFGEAVYDYNARVGELFAPVQGGVYAGPAVSELVEFFRRENVAGVGQSSWGPGVFAFVEDEERARWLRERLPTSAEAWLARGVNHGATLE
jgi:beta-RFAP synthase